MNPIRIYVEILTLNSPRARFNSVGARIATAFLDSTQPRSIKAGGMAPLLVSRSRGATRKSAAMERSHSTKSDSRPTVQRTPISLHNTLRFMMACTKARHSTLSRGRRFQSTTYLRASLILFSDVRVHDAVPSFQAFWLNFGMQFSSKRATCLANHVILDLTNFVIFHEYHKQTKPVLRALLLPNTSSYTP
jgi:hypothetical protein